MRRIVLTSLVVSLTGCASFEPQADYDRTTELIHRQTDVGATYQPGAEPAAAQAAVEEMLRDGLTVDEAVGVAMLNNPDLQAMFHDVGLASAEVLNAGLLSNPTLAASVRFPEAGGRANVTTAVSQNVAEFFLIPIRRRIAESRLEQTQLHVAEQAVDLIASVKQAAYSLIAIEEAARITRQNLELAEHSVELAQRRFAAGEADKLDVNVAQIDVLDVKRQVLGIDRQREIAHADLGQLLGLGDRPDAWTMADRMLDPIDLPETPALIERAMEQRLDLRIADLRIDEARREIEREKLGVISDLSVGVERERADSPPNLTGPTIDVTLPLWHQNQPQVARAELALSIRERQLEAARNAAVTEVLRAAAAVRANAALVRFFDEQSLPLARRHVEATAHAYENGLHDILRLAQAQQTLIEQRIEFARTLNEYAASLADLERAMGGRIAPAAEAAPDPDQVEHGPDDLPRSGPA